MYDLLFDGIVNVLHWKYFAPLMLGTLVGVVGGGLPGITNTMTVIIVLPFTFGLEPLQGLAAMIGVYVGGESGGLAAPGRTGKRRDRAATIQAPAVTASRISCGRYGIEYRGSAWSTT